MKSSHFGRLPALLLAFGIVVQATPVAHPDRPDRLVETRDGFSVEYSPGQEAWMEMGFVQLRAEARKPTASAVPTPAVARPRGPAVPGSAQYLQENRDVILANIARHTGLPKPTALQGRVFDTFLGYYKIASELMQNVVREMPATLTARRLAIWQRDDLIARLRTGAKIEGMAYDPATDSGQFKFEFNVDSSAIGERVREIHAEIEAQKLKHTLEYGQGKYSASVMLDRAPDATKPVKQPSTTPDDLDAIIAGMVFPVIYRGEIATAPVPENFDYLSHNLAAAREAWAQQMTAYRDPTLVSIILHETAEVGLVENIISSQDRRWLCDGTANYTAWRVARDLLGAEFASQVYNLEAQLRQHAALQPKIDLSAWSAVEHQKENEADTELNRAHYTFATRAMFLLTERHGENALAQLWSDVARTPKAKNSAKTFAAAYRKRFKADLGKLIREAQQYPIPTESSPANPKA